MRTPPCFSERRLRYLLLKHITPTKLKKHKTANSKITRVETSHKGLSRLLARRKIAKCTQHCFKIRSSELIMLIYFMKFTIEMKFVRKIISTHTKCREKAHQMQETQKILMRVDPRRNLNSPSLRCMIPLPLIRSLRS